jgi:malonyl-CoA O-methyltransferase
MDDAFHFDRAAVRRAFDRAAASYDAHAVLQREVGARLLERLDYMRVTPARVLDLGCGTGAALAGLRARYPDAGMVALDLAPAMLARARLTQPRPGLVARALAHLAPGRAGVAWVCGDMERLPFARDAFGLVWSNLALQWADDLAATLRGVHHVLRPGGLLTFSTFGPDTLRELRAAFAVVDDAPHVSRFTDLHDIGDMLVAAGFANPVMEMEMLTLTYPDLRALMLDLKGLGAHNAAAARRRGMMGRAQWARLVAAYETHRREGRLPASFEVIYGHAWVGDKTRREDGRQVIELKIASRRRALGTRA